MGENKFHFFRMLGALLYGVCIELAQLLLWATLVFFALVMVHSLRIDTWSHLIAFLLGIALIVKCRNPRREEV